MNEFWAALGGAVIGGLITAVTSWRLLKAQWQREDDRQREQAIWDEFEKIHEALKGINLGESWMDPKVLVGLQIHLGRLGNLVGFRDPALYQVIEEVMTKLTSEQRATWVEGVNDLIHLSLNWIRNPKSLGHNDL